MSSLLTHALQTILLGDFNVKHTEWGCLINNSKGEQLLKWINENKLILHNSNMKTSLRSSTTIDLIISNQQIGSVNSSLLPYTCSDHYPIFIEFSNIVITSKDQQSFPKTYWNVYQVVLSAIYKHIEELYSDIHDEHHVFIQFQNLLRALRSRVTVWARKNTIRPTLPPSVRILLKYKHYLQNRYYKTKLENDRLALRLWTNIIKHEIVHHRARMWNKILSKIASPNPTTFWRNIKLINKKRTINFCGITDDNNFIHKTPQSIISCLQDHFEKRFASPLLNLQDKTDAEASTFWQEPTRISTNQLLIQDYMNDSDLKFNVQDLQNIIKSLANKASSSFDRISNQTIKLIPTEYYQLLIDQYNILFKSARWEPEWKCARLLCFNKVDSPVPKPSQLRPINLLPVFSKLYEKLFLLKFNKGLTNSNILPRQQSGSRRNQSTTTRVHHLLQQLTQSLTYNSISTAVYIDFLQAYDKLWQQGLLLKLSNLQCPPAYMYWITNYFKGRTCIIDIDEQISSPININSGVPQGSCFAGTAFIVDHYDLPDIFDQPHHAHLFVDDLAIIYTPSIFLSFQTQITNLEKIIIADMAHRLNYSRKWHQPVNHEKCKFVIYYTCVRPPHMNIFFNSTAIKQSKQFKYLGYILDHRLSFNAFIKQQLIKMNNVFPILKYIHKQYPIFFSFKTRFFNAFIWPHFNYISIIYVLCSPATQETIHRFYRKCLRIIYCLQYTTNHELHEQLKLPTLRTRFQKIIQKRLLQIQQHEQELLATIGQHQQLKITLEKHFTKQKCIPHLPKGRLRKRIINFYQNNKQTIFDRLLSFCNE